MKGSPSPINTSKLNWILAHLEYEDNFVFLETTRVSEDDFLSYLFLKPVGRVVCRAGDDPAAFFAKAQTYLDEGCYLAGYLSYEFGCLLEKTLQRLIGDNLDQVVAEFGVYRKPYIYDHRQAGFVDGAPWPEAERVRPGVEDDFSIYNLTFSQRREDYLERVESIKRYIEEGDTYQVNYTLKLLFDFAGVDSSLYKALRRNQSVSYGAYIKKGARRILSFSPELFFRKTGSNCRVRPMKGTMRRGPDLSADAAVRKRLSQDVKNRSENIMIVDLLRNDLGRLCRMGEVETVSLFDVETYETLHQMTSTISGELKSDVGLAELFGAIFPCGSVTGAPKIRTMEIIHDLENEPRGVYTGGIGFITPKGDGVFNVPIRTVVLDGKRGEMGIGSGIVYDSDPAREWDECRLKGKFLEAPFPEFELIETILYHPRLGFWLLEHHLDRLARSAGYWGFVFDREKTVSALHRKMEFADSEGSQRIRLLLHKDGVIDIEIFGCPDLFQPGQGENNDIPEVVLSSSRIDSSDPFYYHKTTFRKFYDLERRKALEAGYYEVLYRNERDEMTEGAITNLFVKSGGRLLTPPVNSGLLAGVLREALLAGEIEPPDGLVSEEQVITLADLKEAEAIYIGNSVRGMIRVRLTDGELA